MHIHDAAGDTPNTVNTSVVRTRRYLTGREVERLIEAARKHGRYGHRDATMILLAYRHGLRASELCDLQWHQVELNLIRQCGAARTGHIDPIPDGLVSLRNPINKPVREWNFHCALASEKHSPGISSGT
jgi:integrase